MPSTLAIAVCFAACAQAHAASPDPDRALLRALSTRGATLSADRVVERVWDVAPEVAQAEARIRAVEAEVERITWRFLPQASFGASAQRIGGFEDGSISGPGGQPISITVPRTRYGVDASLRYSLTDVVFGALSALDAAETEVDAEEARAEIVRADLERRVREVYWAHVRARGAWRVTERSVARAEAHRARIDERATVGLATPADVAAARARLSEARADRAAARSARDTTRDTLALLMDRPLPDVIAVPEAALSAPEAPASASALEVIAARRRRELVNLDRAVDGVKARRAALWADRLPDLRVSAGASYRRPNPNVVPPRDELDPSWRVGVELEVSPNDWLDAESRSDRFSAQVVRLERQRERLRREIRLEVRTQVSALEDALERLDATRDGVRAAVEAYRARKVAHDEGRAPFTEVLDADVAVGRAELAFLTALTDARIAAVRLRRATGGLTGA